ncbi:MAG: hypothetical protein WB611_22290 [Stellaceae bacterium]
MQGPSTVIRPLSGSASPLAHPVRAVDPRTRYPGVDLAALAEALLAIKADVEPASPRPHLTGA